MMISVTPGVRTFNRSQTNDRGRNTNIAANIRGTNKSPSLAPCLERERGSAYAASRLSKRTAILAVIAMIAERSSPAAKNVSASRGRKLKCGSREESKITEVN